MHIKKIVKDALVKECWSANGKYNYAPIKHLKTEVFKDGYKRRQFNRFYRNLHKVTDARTYFAYLFRRFDIYVWCGDILYCMNQSFPDVSDDTVKDWILEDKREYQVLFDKFWEN